MANKLTIGILALQGAFIEHTTMLNRLGIDSFEIRQKKDLLRPMDGIILPGGESTTMFKLLNDLDMTTTIKDLIKNGLPTFGTCAGMLLLAKTVDNYHSDFLGTMNIAVKKNAYGRQLGSFRTTGAFASNQNIPFVFIRAPHVTEYSDDVEVLSIVNDKIVAVREHNQLATAFHPELTTDTSIHQYFIDMCQQ